MKTDSYIGPNLSSDDELEQLTAYVSGSMTAAEEQAFDDRLAEDDEFFDRMSPLLKVWWAPPPSVIEAGERLKVRLAGDQSATASKRGRVPLWMHHRMIALGSLAAAASMIFGALLRYPVQQELTPILGKRPTTPARTAPPQAVAQTPSPNPGKAIRRVVEIPLHRGSGATAIQLPALTPLPPVRLTPTATVVAQNVEIVLRGAGSDPGQRMLGSDRRNVIPQNAGAPGDRAVPGKGYHLPRFGLGKIWNWIRHKKTDDKQPQPSK